MLTKSTPRWWLLNGLISLPRLAWFYNHGKIANALFLCHRICRTATDFANLELDSNILYRKLTYLYGIILWFIVLFGTCDSLWGHIEHGLISVWKAYFPYLFPAHYKLYFNMPHSSDIFSALYPYNEEAVTGMICDHIMKIFNLQFYLR